MTFVLLRSNPCHVTIRSTWPKHMRTTIKNSLSGCSVSFLFLWIGLLFPFWITFPTNRMLGAVVLCALLPAVVLAGPLQWPQKYTTSGLIILPYGDISEPFTAVVDMDSGKSYLNTYESENKVLLQWSLSL